MKNFNSFFYIPIFSFLLTLLLWFVWLHRTLRSGVLWLSIGLSVIAFIIYALPDPTDTQDGKDAANWRAWVPVIICIIAIFLPVIIFATKNSIIK